jgi:hypothetical protein
MNNHLSHQIIEHKKDQGAGNPDPGFMFMILNLFEVSDKIVVLRVMVFNQQILPS